MLLDYHVHSDYSDDSWYLMEDIVKDAIALGLDEICFTEHVDYGVKEDWKEGDTYLVGGNKIVKNVNYPLYFKEIKSLRKKYEGKIAIKIGMEFGMQVHTIDRFQDLYDQNDFDFILLSIHQVEDKEFWTNEFQKGKSDAQIYQEYYEEMYRLVKSYKDYSCLAHMDLIRRYLDDKEDRFEENKAIIEKILRQVIADGKGIELNTSSERYGLDGLTPSIEILKLYHDLGGKVITIGSDSHKKEHLGFKIEESKKLLKDLGFDYYYSFDRMKPVFHSLGA